MAKTIKFSLILDNTPVIDLDGVRENFNIDDILRYYKSGLLQKWLAVRGFTDTLSRLEDISAESDLEISKELVKIFEMEIEATKLEESLYSIQFHEEWQNKVNDYAKNNFNRKAIINDYHQGYDALLKGMLQAPDDIALIKSSMAQIAKNYLWIFKYHLPCFYDEFIEKVPLSIFVSFMNPSLRKLLLESEVMAERLENLTSKINPNTANKISDDFTKDHNLFDRQSILNRLGINLKPIKHKADTNHRWQQLVSSDKKCLIIDLTERDNVMVSHSDPNLKSHQFKKQDAVGKILNGLRFYSYRSDDYVEYITFTSEKDLVNSEKQFAIPKMFYLVRNHLKTFKGETEEFWKDIEPKGKRFMIIGMNDGNYVRNSGKHGEELSADDVNGKFVILDGIDYKSKNPDHVIGYLEV
ncbi:MAG: hypothetical protein F6J90_17045 [Moorea sp. SIOASIH]|uniref:hypothetical protein n=1 Tax=Moorena sp. SIOASIH TaxID=2607817 RepID=UPI0013B8FA1D|nr:hypothetical protein [Moorena sp. SIOASIH]NEO37942.1 hypothetical protein [Moorena sp. SIOASIH]